MGTNPASDLLTRTYRTETNRIRAAIIRDVTRIWPLFSTVDTGGSWPGVLAALKAIVTSYRQTSIKAAQQYMTSFRFAEEISGDFRAAAPRRLPKQQLEASLTVTGLVQYRKARLVGNSPESAANSALATVSGAASRLALNGGRDLIIDSARSDQYALGWMRVARPGCCAFCAMLASRGPVYRSDSTAGGGIGPDGNPNRWHDHCNCTVEPVYHRATALPDVTAVAADMWAQTSRGTHGRDAVRAFRAAWDAHRNSSRPGGEN